MSTLYERRVKQEWRLLKELAELNPEIIQECSRSDAEGIQVFAFTLRHTQALVEQGEELLVIDEHRVSIHLPRFFPSVPMEVSLARPVFHPNVHPESGFVCLWDRFSSAKTVAEAITQLQRVITWELFSEEAEHVMQTRALHQLLRATLAAHPIVRAETTRRDDSSPTECATRRWGKGRRRLE